MGGHSLALRRLLRNRSIKCIAALPTARPASSPSFASSRRRKWPLKKRQRRGAGNAWPRERGDGRITRGDVSTKRAPAKAKAKSRVQMHASTLNENSKRSVTGPRKALPARACRRARSWSVCSAISRALFLFSGSGAFPRWSCLAHEIMAAARLTIRRAGMERAGWARPSIPGAPLAPRSAAPGSALGPFLWASAPIPTGGMIRPGQESPSIGARRPR